MPDTHLILHVKGTESETTELPRQVVRAAISRGQITHSQLIWSPEENTWKQVREMPNLLPSQRLAPAPAPRIPTSPLPKIAAVAVPRVQGVPVPRIAGKASTETPVARAVPVEADSNQDLVIRDEEGNRYLKRVYLGLGVVILLTLGGNFFLVDEPLRWRLAETPYSNVTVHGHFGAFMQPNVLLIHIPVSSAVTRGHLTGFLVALAHSTPQSPITNSLFDRVVLTSGWMGQYSFSGFAWKKLGEMGQDDPAQQKEFIMYQMEDASGQSLMPASTLSEETQQAMHDKIWETFAAQFSHS